MGFNWKRLFLKESALKPQVAVEPTINANAVAAVGSGDALGAAAPERSRRAEDNLPNPYLNYRRRWNDHTGSILSQRNMWMMFCIASMLITLAAVGGIMHIGSQSKFVPYIVEVDKLGQSVAAHPAQQITNVDSRVLQATAAEFISNARLVTPDVQLQRNAIFKLYAVMVAGDPGAAKMNEHLNGVPEQNPFQRAAKETVSVEILSVLQQTGQTWQVDWIETVRDRKGQLASEPFRMRALVNVTTIPPTPETTEQQLRMNPLGVYIVDYNWSRTL